MTGWWRLEVTTRTAARDGDWLMEAWSDDKGSSQRWWLADGGLSQWRLQHERGGRWHAWKRTYLEIRTFGKIEEIRYSSYELTLITSPTAFTVDYCLEPVRHTGHNFPHYLKPTFPIVVIISKYNYYTVMKDYVQPKNLWQWRWRDTMKLADRGLEWRQGQQLEMVTGGWRLGLGVSGERDSGLIPGDMNPPVGPWRNFVSRARGHSTQHCLHLERSGRFD